MPPTIGITTGIDDPTEKAPQQKLPIAYVQAVERAGGSPLIVPMVERRETLAPILDRIDGLLITGGAGITQRLIGELPDDLPPERDERTFADQWIYEGAVQKGVAVLGVCYGMQFINAMHGGSICGDVRRERGKSPHSPKRNGGADVVHPVSVSEATVLRALVGEEGDRVDVNSFHIQAVEEIGGDLRINAISPDGVIEGIESDDGHVMGVQFHPERMQATVWGKFFEHLVKASTRV